MTTDITDMVSSDPHIYSNEKKSNHVGILKSISKWKAQQTAPNCVQFVCHSNISVGISPHCVTVHQ